MKYKHLVFTIFLLCLMFNLSAQKLEPSKRFDSLTKACNIEFLKPLDAGYKSIWVGKNSLQQYDFAIRSRKEKLEIRYLIEPHQENNPTFSVPHMKCIQKVLTIASNEQDVVMTGLDISEKSLQEDYNADWGKVFFFRPKAQFSTYKHIKMLALFKEGRGMAYVFFLFDKPTRNLDNRIIALRYNESINPTP